MINQETNGMVIPYQWTDRYLNGSYYPEKPYFYNFVYEPKMGERYYPPYNITKLFATSHKAGNTVLNSSTSRSDLKIVASKNDTTWYIILTNTNASSIITVLNIPLSGKYLKDVETGEAYSLVNGVTPQFNISGYGVKTMNSEDGTPLSITNTPSGDIIIAGHTASINTTIDSVNPLDTVSVNLSGVVTNIKDPSLILCYNFDNRSALNEDDLNVTDWCGNNTGKVMAATSTTGTNITIINSKYTSGLYFNKTNTTANTNGYVNVTFKNDLYGLDNFTVMAWVNLSEDLSAKAIFRQTIGTNTRWLIVDGIVSVKLVDDINKSNYGTWSCTIKSNNKNILANIAVVFNNNSGMNVYINGINECNDTVYGGNSSNFSIGFNGKINNMRIGQGYDFNGTIDEFRYWNRSLTSKEIEAIYNISITKINNSKYELYFNKGYYSFLNTYQIIVNDTLSNENKTILKYIIRGQQLNIYSNNYGSVNNNFYGANIHYASRLMSGSDAEWLKNAWSGAKLNYARIDASIGSFYSGIKNLDFESYSNDTIVFINSSKYASGVSMGRGL